MLVKKVISLNSLNANILVILTDSPKKAIRKLLKDGYDLPNNTRTDDKIEGLTGYCTINEATKFYSIIRIQENLKEVYKTVVHEMYHATQDILENRGVKYKKGDPNETYAYTQDYLFGELYDFIIKQHNKKYNGRRSKVKINNI